MSFACTSLRMKNGEIRYAGQTVRSSHDAFSQAVILGFDQIAADTVMVKLARPHVAVINAGTARPGVALMIHEYTITDQDLEHMDLVDANLRVLSYACTGGIVDFLNIDLCQK